jgi:hypothetical protein
MTHFLRVGSEVGLAFLSQSGQEGNFPIMGTCYVRIIGHDTLSQSGK